MRARGFSLCCNDCADGPETHAAEPRRVPAAGCGHFKKVRHALDSGGRIARPAEFAQSAAMLSRLCRARKNTYCAANGRGASRTQRIYGDKRREFQVAPSAKNKAHHSQSPHGTRWRVLPRQRDGRLIVEASPTRLRGCCPRAFRDREIRGGIGPARVRAQHGTWAAWMISHRWRSEGSAVTMRPSRK